MSSSYPSAGQPCEGGLDEAMEHAEMVASEGQTRPPPPHLACQLPPSHMLAPGWREGEPPRPPPRLQWSIMAWDPGSSERAGAAVAGPATVHSKAMGLGARADISAQANEGKSVPELKPGLPHLAQQPHPSSMEWRGRASEASSAPPKEHTPWQPLLAQPYGTFGATAFMAQVISGLAGGDKMRARCGSSSASLALP